MHKKRNHHECQRQAEIKRSQREISLANNRKNTVQELKILKERTIRGAFSGRLFKRRGNQLLIISDQLPRGQEKCDVCCK